MPFQLFDGLVCGVFCAQLGQQLKGREVMVNEEGKRDNVGHGSF